MVYRAPASPVAFYAHFLHQLVRTGFFVRTGLLALAVGALTASAAAPAAAQEWQVEPGTTHLYYDGGRVGVGMNSPRFDLDVAGTIYTQRLYASGFRMVDEDVFPSEGSITEGQYGTYMLFNQSTDRTLRLGVSNDLYTKAEIEFDNRNWGGGWINFKTSSSMTPAATRMRIDRHGNVGIGTTSPSERLAVNGKVRAKEVIVETGWSDFVFEEGYDLPTLDEVKLHIDEHGHLPDMPSAEEVKREGVRLGAIEARLLQKIEELTLYAIEQEERANLMATQLAEQHRRTQSRAPSIGALDAESERLRAHLEKQQQQIRRLMRRIEEIQANVASRER